MRALTLITLLLISSPIVILGQNVHGVISTSELSNYSIVSKSSSTKEIQLKEVITTKGNWSNISKSLNISNPKCKNQISGKWCRFSHSGLEITYSDYPGTYTFSEMTLSNNNFKIVAKNTHIMVGGSITVLKNLCKDAYNKRHAIPGETNLNQVLLFLEGTDLSISYEYKPSNNTITSIRIYQPIM
ncbi:hypothetical protein [Roseivirga pacifica]